MVVYEYGKGFTIVEMVVTTVIVTLFLTLFFQAFLSAQSRQLAVTRLAAANNISQTNLNKISSKALIPSSTAACDSTGSSPNNPLANSSATGSIIATNATSGVTTPTWTTAGLAPESLDKTALPSNSGQTVQMLQILYPKGCSPSFPAKIISTITYGSETVTHAAYIN